ncbi:MAG: poly(3-hydroxybutyrate) depolymerase, partial [Candidatus Binataceae bacterium]|nr:poly(3-hydroxybutyrate) depolymerase [Candidatus Binataceae bacterium]
PSAPMSEGTVDGYPHQVWWNADGETTVESYTITDMAHGTPLGVADNDERYGAQGAFLIEAGISSSYHIANFFGLTDWIGQSKEVVKEAVKQGSREASTKPLREPLKELSTETLKEAARPIPEPSVTPVRTADIATALRPLATLSRHPAPPPRARNRNIDVGAVITRALTAAGLMK